MGHFKPYCFQSFVMSEQNVSIKLETFKEVVTVLWLERKKEMEDL